MIDIHSHILYGIDDGSKTLEDSIKILDSAYENGVTKIFVTPHYIEESKYMCPNNVKKKILNELKKIYSGKIDLYIGNEIYVNDNIDKYIKNGEISTLGDSKYLLIELPVYNEYPGLEDYLFRLRDMSYKIIIAHPERYYYFKNNFKKLLEMCKQGIYFQGNYMSLYDVYGKDAKNLFIKILKHRCYSFMASDIHSSEQKYYKKVADAKKRITFLTDKAYTERIFNSNAAKIMTDDVIEVDFKEKLSFFNRIRGNE